MCGIVMGIRKDKVPANKSVLKRYRKQRHRGQRGFGFIGIENGRVVTVNRAETEADIENQLNSCTAAEIMFHHRLPTSTPNYKDMTHPIEVKNKTLEKNYYVIHNGVLSNEDELKTKHEKLGFKYTTFLRERNIVETRSGQSEVTTEQFNDSESLAIEVARFLERKSEKIDIIGTAAFVCIQTDKKGFVEKIHYAHNSGNPLILEDNNDIFFIKSEGDGKKLDEDVLYTMDYKTKEITSREAKVGARYKVSSYTPVNVPPRTPAGFGQTSRTAQADASFRESIQSGSTLSPIQPSSLLGWGEDDINDDIAVIPFGDTDIVQDYQANFRRYQKTPGYLDELLAEIEALKNDIKDCKRVLEYGVTADEDELYDQDYLLECVDSLTEKEIEADQLHNYLLQKGAIR